ncbi:helix-turn-helix transcriptional regulator [Nocardioides sp. URHA0032]|uniref:helix-turn-helix transcriptional regulator n=1 Tax=Nocardioides sp. URHA0032 TaxID=1380388 RepID=UPI0004919557|nr:LuxR C-terminal-related transcriptional regulator [Nocardioides sp. URHA0032]
MPRPGSTSVLTALGFSAQVDRTYQRLRSQSGRDLERLAASMLRTPAELLDQIAPLLRAGIVRRDGDQLVVEPPAEAVRILVAGQAVHAQRLRRQLEGITDAVGLLAAEEGRAVPSEHEGRLPIDGEVVTAADRAEIYDLVRSLVLGSSGDLLWLRPDQWRGPREDRMAGLVGEALRGSGRASRAIYPVHAVGDPKVLSARAAVGEQVRVLPEVPTRMLVIGDSHVVLPEPLGYADMPLAVVRQRGVVEAMAQWFELLWERAAVPAGGVAGRPDRRRFLLQQLAAGERDEQIARKLGISLRTVRRRVADLMSELGADSRFQAGVEAARRGWI